jgi:hypothetical protein
MQSNVYGTMAHVSNAMPIFDMHIKAEEWRIRHATFGIASPHGLNWLE